jgi:N-succinyldiaminopimelate aminotransferase
MRPLGHPALAPFGTTIFATMSALALRHNAINLGQGFPDTDGPPQVLEAAVAAIRGGRNQYPPGPGVPELLTAIADHQRRFYGIELAPESEILVTVGATEAIAATVLALVQPGDEVVTFEPYYDSYAATIALAGGVRRTSVLRFPDFAVDEASLRAAFSDRAPGWCCSTLRTTRPARSSRGTSSTLICAAGPRSRCVGRHRRGVRAPALRRPSSTCQSSTLPGMFERTITISSAGKTFSTTGWKVGWVMRAGGDAVAAVRAVKQFLTYVSSGPFQPAVAAGLALGDPVYAELADVPAGASVTCCAPGSAIGRAAACLDLPRAPTSSSPTRLRWERQDAVAFCH